MVTFCLGWKPYDARVAVIYFLHAIVSVNNENETKSVGSFVVGGLCNFRRKRIETHNLTDKFCEEENYLAKITENMNKVIEV